MSGALRFIWNATSGFRLRPWQSPYLKWRVETYTGKSADTVTLRDFIALAKSEGWQLLTYLRWTHNIGRLASGR